MVVVMDYERDVHLDTNRAGTTVKNSDYVMVLEMAAISAALWNLEMGG